VVSVPLVRSNQPMTASNTCRHSREPLACDIPRQGLTQGSDGHAIKLTRAKAAPLQRWLNGPDGRKLIPTGFRILMIQRVISAVAGEKTSKPGGLPPRRCSCPLH
jgi:hypothetical protein